MLYLANKWRDLDLSHLTINEQNYVAAGIWYEVQSTFYNSNPPYHFQVTTFRKKGLDAMIDRVQDLRWMSSSAEPKRKEE